MVQFHVGDVNNEANPIKDSLLYLFFEEMILVVPIFDELLLLDAFPPKVKQRLVLNENLGIAKQTTEKTHKAGVLKQVIRHSKH